MLKTTYQYEQTAARLVVEGFPDLSAGQSNEAIGILSSWRLQLIGAPELEGTRDHLEALMAAVMPYARHRLSGVQRRFGLESDFVSIAPDQTNHGWNCAAAERALSHCSSSSMTPNWPIWCVVSIACGSITGSR